MRNTFLRNDYKWKIQNSDCHVDTAQITEEGIMMQCMINEFQIFKKMTFFVGQISIQYIEYRRSNAAKIIDYFPKVFSFILNCHNL